MDNKQYFLDVITAINEVIEDENWFDNKEEIEFLYDRVSELKDDMELRLHELKKI